MRPVVAVIGGGITGLSAAHALAKYASNTGIALLEASNRLGGVLETTRQNGFLIEAAADNFLTDPPAVVDLCQEIGKTDSLISTDTQNRRSFVVRRGQLVPIPTGFVAMAPTRLWPLLKSRALSWRGKCRAGWEYFIPPKATDEDESVASFVCRRFGRELYERLVQPLVGSIYGGTPDQLSVAATMPSFQQMEREFGSLIRATLHKRQAGNGDNASGARYSRFAAMRDGMSSLIESLAESLPAGTIHLSSPVNSIVRLERDRWLLVIGGDRPRWLEADALILAAPAYRSARLLAGIDSALARGLGQITYSSCAIVSLGYRREQINGSLDGFGFVVPNVERRKIRSCSYSSVKYAGRAPDGAVLLRAFFGGANQQDLLQLPEDELVALAHSEVGELLHIEGQPILHHIIRRRHAIPQYYVGHGKRMEMIHQRLARFSTLTLAGSAYCGVGIPACIRSGQSAAERCVSQLNLRAQPSCLRTSDAETLV